MRDSRINDEIMGVPSVDQTFAGKNILVTGASGFIGKVLVEKLLRCCPSVSHIYLLMRSKKNKSPVERWESITEQEVFSRLKEEYPQALQKVIVVEGDAILKGLGLSKTNKKILEEEISVIFHSAASVRFNDPIIQAINLNTRGSLELLKLAKQMTQLMCFVYVSTTYSNSHLNIPLIEEKVYPSEYNYKDIIKLTETENPAHLNLLCLKILGKHPNTYTFSKSLAEQIMNDYHSELPVVVVRPSVVINSLYEPVPGWVDNLTGVLGIITGIGTGLLKVSLGKPSVSLDYVTVDYAVNSLIAAAWHKSTIEGKSCSELTIYNCAYGNIRKVAFSDIMNYGLKAAIEKPFHSIFWYPSAVFVDNSMIYRILFYLVQLFPAAIGDLYLYLTGSKPMLINLNRKIFIASFAMRLFSSKSFYFSNTNNLSLSRSLSKKDQDIFFMIPPDDMTIKQIIEIGLEGIKKYYFKDNESDNAKYLAKLNRFYWMDKVLRFIVYLVSLWLLYCIIKLLIEHCIL